MSTQYIEVTVPRKQTRRWTPEEDAYLIENADKWAIDLVQPLQRTSFAIQARKQTLRKAGRLK